MALADVIYRMATDKAFAAQLQSELEGTPGTASSALAPEEREALRAMLLAKGQWHTLCSPDLATPDSYPWINLLAFSGAPCPQPVAAS